MKKFIALLIIFANFLVPVSAENVIAEEIPVQEFYSYEPIVHEEFLPAGTEINRELLMEDAPQLSALNDDDEISTAALDVTKATVWNAVYCSAYGEDFLSPHMKSNDEIRLSGKTNKLLVTNTDLSLPGKNGLDVVIKREYDSQYDNYTYVGMNDGNALVQNSVYLYTMKNTETNENVYVGVYSEDFYYIYLDEGIYLSDWD